MTSLTWFRNSAPLWMTSSVPVVWRVISRGIFSMTPASRSAPALKSWRADASSPAGAANPVSATPRSLECPANWSIAVRASCERPSIPLAPGPPPADPPGTMPPVANRWTRLRFAAPRAETAGRLKMNSPGLSMAGTVSPVPLPPTNPPSAYRPTLKDPFVRSPGMVTTRFDGECRCASRANASRIRRAASTVAAGIAEVARRSPAPAAQPWVFRIRIAAVGAPNRSVKTRLSNSRRCAREPSPACTWPSSIPDRASACENPMFWAFSARFTASASAGVMSTTEVGRRPGAPRSRDARTFASAASSVGMTPPPPPTSGPRRGAAFRTRSRP